MDITRATEVTPEVADTICDMFEYHTWEAVQCAKGKAVREALQAAFTAIVANVPPSPDRSAALRKLRDCRMDCNSAITHNGKY